ncbi:hypothetical protein DKX38_030165 [Salix brachista]|uniref:Uncharacterized protein n=1 Tax=Salix brachista TaxID=2182728 RepID=A0A5N5IUU2_9ROSI|nr:hypothetical protein DKX38_030165 [Salix brachista]
MRPNLSVEFLWRLSLTILLVSAITSTSTAAVLKRNSSPIFNPTIGEGNEEEFSMESDVHQRLIASQRRAINYRALEKQQICNSPICGSCLKPANRSSQPCTYYNRCKRFLNLLEAIKLKKERSWNVHRFLKGFLFVQDKEHLLDLFFVEDSSFP